MSINIKNSQGFTLLELLLALTIFMIVVGAVYATALTQQKSYIVQEQIASIQQNLRAGMSIMERYIRMAGYEMVNNKVAGITTITPNSSITFTHEMFEKDEKDNDNDGIEDESGELRTITFAHDLANRELDITIDGSTYAIADNIDAVQFRYLDANNQETNSPASVRSVLISMVASSVRQDLDYKDTKDYSDHADEYSFTNDAPRMIFPPANDNLRRRELSVLVRCRNISWP